MYILDPQKKEDPARRWNLPDRIFFGHGACHILCGIYLQMFADSKFKPYWIKPAPGLPGMHVFVSDGKIAFDYHGYSVLNRLERHHRKVWESQIPNWNGELLKVDFELLNTQALNEKNMRGPDQYYGDVIERATKFVSQVNHEKMIKKARKLLRG